MYPYIFNLSEMPKISLIFTHIPSHGITLVHIHELVVRVQQLASVAHLVRVLHQSRRFDSCQRAYSRMALPGLACEQALKLN